MDSSKEKELIEMARNGREEAFRQLVEANMRRVYSVALKFTYRHADADDIAQETFIKAYQALKKFQGNSSFGTWVYRIAINCCLNRKRSKARKIEESHSDELNEMIPDDRTPSMERAVFGGQVRGKVEKALGKLSKQQRAIFIMKHLQHQKISEIAEHLGCAEGTVKQQLFRAVRRMRDELKPLIQKQEVVLK